MSLGNPDNSVSTALGQIALWPTKSRTAAAFDATTATLTKFGNTQEVSRIASVSKPLFAYAILIALEEGLFGLDSTVHDLVSPEMQSQIHTETTVAHLLSHTSGLSFEARQSPICSLGTKRIYSNFGFEVLAQYLEQVANMPAGDYLKFGVFEPLGMSSSYLNGSTAKDVFSCLDDLCKFAIELCRPRLIGSTTLDLATSIHRGELSGTIPGLGHYNPCPWGLGFEIKGTKSPHWMAPSSSPQTFGHFGGTGSFLFVDPINQLAMVGLTNTVFGEHAKHTWPTY